MMVIAAGVNSANVLGRLHVGLRLSDVSKKSRVAPNGYRRGFPGYVGAHLRVKKSKGKASQHACPCGKKAAHWALDHTQVTEHWRVDNGSTSKYHGCVFSVAVEDYVAKCCACNTADGSPNDAQIGDMLYRMGRVSRPDLLEQE
jgi:hypothetical protein